MLEIVHPDVQIGLRSQVGEVLRGREAVEEFLQAIAGRHYQAVAEVYRPLDEQRIVVEGRMRWTDEDHVMRDTPIAWALEFRDGLLFRSFPTQSTLEAESILSAVRSEDLSSEDVRQSD